MAFYLAELSKPFHLDEFKPVRLKNLWAAIHRGTTRRLSSYAQEDITPPEMQEDSHRFSYQFFESNNKGFLRTIRRDRSAESVIYNYVMHTSGRIESQHAPHVYILGGGPQERQIFPLIVDTNTSLYVRRAVFRW